MGIGGWRLVVGWHLPITNPQPHPFLCSNFAKFISLIQVGRLVKLSQA
jgi:hypothetical protein